jgi:DNA-binding transcriptional regulator YdaS (Cro superfamily)
MRTRVLCLPVGMQRQVLAHGGTVYMFMASVTATAATRCADVELALLPTVTGANLRPGLICR